MHWESNTEPYESLCSALWMKDPLRPELHSVAVSNPFPSGDGVCIVKARYRRCISC
jgi:hypothetical protein